MTLEGHPEAGRIRFEAHALDGRPDALRFEIHSLARSRDGLVAFAYDTLGGGKLMQEATWVEFCRRVAPGQRRPGPGRRSRSKPFATPKTAPRRRKPTMPERPTPPPPPALGAVPRPPRRLRPHAASTTTTSRQTEYTSATGWRLDDYATDLPAEAPGPARAGRSVRRRPGRAAPLRLPAARPHHRLSSTPDQPLEKRVMVLRAHFLVFNFYFGVRVSDVVDEAARATPGGPERVWGYGYRTLEGHFERGQINFSIHKNLTTGAVQFRIRAVSQPGHHPQPVLLAGLQDLRAHLAAAASPGSRWPGCAGWWPRRWPRLKLKPFGRS
ncbi:MAG: DUF1990 family protein [Hymenobacter sp.]